MEEEQRLRAGTAVVVGVVLAACGVPWAFADQEQYQDQAQAQVAVGVGVGVGVSEAEQANTQATDVSITETHPKEKSLAHGSQALFVPQGNEGVGLQTPWGGPMITQGSQMAKIQALHGLAVEASDAPMATLALQWAVNETRPKELLGINRTERACRNWLLGLLCF